MDDTTRRVDGAPDGAADDEAVTPRTAKIREEIAQTRDELTETIDAIQEKLSPGHIVARATERVKSVTTERVRDMAETASDTAETMMEYGRQTTDRMAGRMGQNPIPAAMIGIGAAWLLMNRAQSQRQVSRWARGESARFDYGANRGTASSTMLPTAIAAVGLAWLAFADGGSSRRTSRGRYWGDRDVYGRGETGWSGSERADTFAKVGASAGQFASRAQEYAGDVASKAQEYAGDMASRTQDYAGEMSHRAQEYASEAAQTMRWRSRQAQDELTRMMHENTWLVGAGALALGAAVGLAIPETEREQEWLGDARDRAVGRAQDMARSAMTNVQNAAGEMAGEVASRIVKGDPQ